MTKFIPFPNKKYNIIYADPPWLYNDKSCIGAVKRAQTSHTYSTININDLKELPVNDITDNNCILFLWATYPLIVEALDLIKSWGFVYKSIGFQWIKINKKSKGYFYGLGRWTRGNTEPCLIATKGKPKRVSSDVFQIIEYPNYGHSAKPPSTRDKIIKLVGPLPRIELFSRDIVKGWDAWGNEIPPNGVHLADNYDFSNEIIYSAKNDLPRLF